jgi:hypothetical protein
MCFAAIVAVELVQMLRRKVFCTNSGIQSLSGAES